MDYEKKYKEAFERARNVWRFSSNNAEIMRMEELFPELRESEGERIRKELIGFLRNIPNSNYTCEEMALWLEKQGQVKESEISQPIKGTSKENDNSLTKKAWSEEDETNLTNTIIMIKEGASHHFANFSIVPCVDWLESLRNRVKPQPDMVEALRTEYEKGRADTIAEMKLSWSEEDINKPNGGIVMEDFNDGNGFYKVNLAYLNEEQVKEIEELVKRWDCQPKENEDESIISDLLDYFEEDKCLKHEVNDVVKWLKTIKPQPNQKWSEEDEKMLDGIVNTVKDVRCQSLLSEIEIYDDYIDWLESIKQRIGG